MKMVDLHRQYLDIRDEVDRAIGDVIAETAFIKGPAPVHRPSGSSLPERLRSFRYLLPDSHPDSILVLPDSENTESDVSPAPVAPARP